MNKNRVWAAALFVILAFSSCRHRERQEELLRKARAANEEASGPTTTSPMELRPDPGWSKVKGVTIDYIRTDKGNAGMLKLIILVRNDSPYTVSRIDGVVEIITSSPQSQLQFQLPIRVGPHESRDYSMDLEPRWPESDEVTAAHFEVRNVVVGE